MHPFLSDHDAREPGTDAGEKFGLTRGRAAEARAAFARLADFIHRHPPVTA